VAEAKSRLIALAAVRDTAVTFSTPELYERTGNVYENKGAIRKSHERSWNVIDNKRLKYISPEYYLK
jgi:hypothetical protein